MVIGLLGGIGSGKSAVAALFAEAGAEVVDADRLAREVLETPARAAEVAARFGPSVSAPDGRIDRQALADRVFADPALLEALNAIIHPPVRERILERVRAHRGGRAGRRAGAPEPVLVLDVPLLAESPLRKECDLLVFVALGEEQRRARLERRGWAPGEVERREARQTPLAEKRAMADFEIDNSGPLEATRLEVARVLRMAGDRRPGRGGSGTEKEVKSLDDRKEQGRWNRR
jgi:dephospho-CoA kinase